MKCHHATNHKNVSSNYPPKSEIRKRKLNVKREVLIGYRFHVKFHIFSPKKLFTFSDDTMLVQSDHNLEKLQSSLTHERTQLTV